MKIIYLTLMLFFTFFICSALYASDVYQPTYDYAYKAGVAQGDSDRSSGYSYSPEVSLNELRIIIRALKMENKHQEDVVDRAFRDGFFDGYKKGYYRK